MYVPHIEKSLKHGKLNMDSFWASDKLNTINILQKLYHTSCGRKANVICCPANFVPVRERTLPFQCRSEPYSQYLGQCYQVDPLYFAKIIC